MKNLYTHVEYRDSYEFYRNFLCQLAELDHRLDIVIGSRESCDHLIATVTKGTTLL